MVEGKREGQEEEEGTEGWREDGGGCHGNWESVAARHHLLLYSAEWSTLIFHLHGHRQTIKKNKKNLTVEPVMETSREKRRVDRQKKGGE